MHELNAQPTDPKDDRSDQRGDSVDAALRFLCVDGVGLGRLRRLRVAFGSFARALDADAAAIAAALGVEHCEGGRILARAREGGALADLERAHATRIGARCMLLSDNDYPELLRASPDPPEILFVRGELDAAPEPAVAIVGSRRATSYGSLQAGTLAVALAEQGVTVVSGGARGIDGEAHRGALRAGGRTIGVLATGFGRPYPAEHGGLFESIVEAGGALVTEQPWSVSARPELFPRRNRVIAALSLVTVVVEAATRSGALLTARLAVDDLSRDAACYPGPVGSALSAGCHRAIREGWAHLVTGADDVLELVAASRSLVAGAREAAKATHAAEAALTREVRGASREVRGASREPSARDLSSDAASVFDAIRGLGRAGFDELEVRLAWPVPRIATAALELELRGAIARDATGAFAPVRAA